MGEISGLLFFSLSLTALMLPGIGHKYSVFYGPNTKVRAISAEKIAVLLPRFKGGWGKLYKIIWES